MTSHLLAELSDLFSLEALNADLRGSRAKSAKRALDEFAEAERLHEISEELHKRSGAELARENGCVEVSFG